MSESIARDDRFRGVRSEIVRDPKKGTTRLTSMSSAGRHGNGTSGSPSISADGRFVAFASTATNLVAGDTNGAADVFVRDRTTGTTERVSISSAGAAEAPSSSAGSTP